MLNKIKSKIYNLLKWSEKYTKTDMIYLSKGGFWLTLKQVSVSVAAFTLSVFFTKILSKETFGVYKYVMTIYGLLSITALSGAFTAIIQASSFNQHNHAHNTFWNRVKFGTAGLILGLVMALYYLKTNSQIAYSLMAISFFIPFIEPLNSYDAVLIGEKKFKKSTIWQIILQLVNLIVTLISLTLTKNIILVILVNFSSLCLIRAVFYYITFKDSSAATESTLIEIQGTDSQSIVTYSKHLSAIDVLNTVTKYLDKILVFHFLGAAELAIYTVATSPPEYASTFLGNIQSLALPKYAKNGEQKSKSLFYKLFIFGLGIIFCTLIYWILAPFFYKIFFPQYIESVPLSRIYSLSLIVILSVVPTSLLQARKKIKTLYIFNTICAISNTIIILISVQFGLYGMIIGRVISRFIMLALSILLTAKTKL